MAVTSGLENETDFLAERPGIWQLVKNFARRHPLGAIGFVIVLMMVIAAIFAPFIAPHDPVEINFEKGLIPPDGTYLLGTDHFGRDILSRIIYGSRTALFVGLVAAIGGCMVGLIIGVTSAYLGGMFDLIFQRITDVWLAFPSIILALTIIVAFGTGMENVILAIAVALVPDCARIVRSSALSIREIPYIDAARANGFSTSRIVFRHIVPNVMAPFLVVVTAGVGQAILAEASLSFLGLGVQEPTPAWGLMLRSGAEEFIESAPWVAIWPGVAISLAVFGANMFGDALRDEFDPRLRSE
ncbi:MAG: ABC transporter permease [Pseudomonadota bacterium]